MKTFQSALEHPLKPRPLSKFYSKVQMSISHVTSGHVDSMKRKELFA